MAKFAETDDGTLGAGDGGYHAVSPAAVASFVFGLASSLALIHPLLWIVPALSFGLAGLALHTISRTNGEVTGRKWALAGIALATVFAVASPVQTLYTARKLSQASRPIADAWFEFLRQGQPQYALQLTVPAGRRRVLNEQLWEFYRSTKESTQELQKFVETPVPRAILEYGEQAQVRFYETQSATTASDLDRADLVYAVTIPDGSAKKTFFVLVSVERKPLPSGQVDWRVAGNSGGLKPTSMSE